MERHVHLLAARRVCRDDGTHIFDPSVHQLAADGVCDLCGGELYQRGTDNEIIIRGRFRSYEATLGAVAQHYAGPELLLTVDVAGTSDEMAWKALIALQKHRPRPATP